ncbi:hypothetical protein EZS27_015766 [termite gut metagenome]|uniref:DUF2442 domain-containing protein n=1 Tax=termite gut metagenome TaxID=433724 RepID=A0A5J4RQT8_9ZZZZ
MFHSLKNIIFVETFNYFMPETCIFFWYLIEPLKICNHGRIFVDTSYRYEIYKEYTMRLEFSDGTKKVIDFFPLLKGQLFEPLKDKNKFVQFALTSWTIE